MQVTIVGVKKSSYGKDGNKRMGYNYSGTKSYTDYELENAECEGTDVITEFSSKDFGIHPGDVVEFMYEPGYQGKAQLVNVRVIKDAGNPFEKDKAADKPAEKK